MKYAVVFEESRRNYAAYVPNLPGWVAIGGTTAEVEQNIREATAFHLDDLKDEHHSIPPPSDTHDEPL